MIIKVEQGKVCAKELDLTKQNNFLLQAMNASKDSIIRQYEEKEKIYQSINSGYDEQLRVKDQQIKLSQDMAGNEHRRYKKQKRKTIGAIIFFALIEGATIYLLAK